MNHSSFFQLAESSKQQQNSSSFNFTPIPTLADRLETYRQLASGRISLTSPNTSNQAMITQPMVSDPFAKNYATNLVERTQDLRNWLKQAKSEHEMLNGSQQTDI